MIDDLKQYAFNLAIIKEGLELIASEADVQCSFINGNFPKYLDSPYDIMPLYYLDYLVERDVVPLDLYRAIKELYKDIGQKTDHLHWREELSFFEYSEEVKVFRNRAKKILVELDSLFTKWPFLIY